jgi:hypothetical protein
VQGQEAVLSALGVRKLRKDTILSDGTQNIIRAMEQHGVRRLVCESSLGVGDSKGQLGWFFNLFLVFLCTALSEIPDRAAAVSQCHRALKAGGILSITEKFGDPHYQSWSTVKRLAEEAGFRLQSIQGGWWFFTANFVKPLARL